MLDSALQKLPEILKRDLNCNLCVCNEVLRIDIIHAIEKGACTVEEVKTKTYATDGNGCCTKQVERLLECLVNTSKDSM